MDVTIEILKKVQSIGGVNQEALVNIEEELETLLQVDGMKNILEVGD